MKGRAVNVAAPTSPINIVNLALQQLYQNPITSFNDTNSPAAGIATNSYDATRREQLRNYDWNFARTRGVAPLDNKYTIPFDFQYAYQLPNNFLKLLWIGPDWRRVFPVTYDIQDTHILIDPIPPNGPVGTQAPWNSLFIKFTQDVTNVALWDSMFVKVMQWALAAEFAMPLTGNIDLMEKCETKLKEIVAEAYAMNHIERPVLITDLDRIGEARLTLSEIVRTPYVQDSWWGNVDAE